MVEPHCQNKVWWDVPSSVQRVKKKERLVLPANWSASNVSVPDCYPIPNSGRPRPRPSLDQEADGRTFCKHVYSWWIIGRFDIVA